MGVDRISQVVLSCLISVMINLCFGKKQYLMLFKVTPISVIEILAKVFQEILMSRILKFIVKHIFITKMQSMYIQVRLTIGIFYFALYKILEAINKNKEVAATLGYS